MLADPRDHKEFLDPRVRRLDRWAPQGQQGLPVLPDLRVCKVRQEASAL